LDLLCRPVSGDRASEGQARSMQLALGWLGRYLNARPLILNEWAMFAHAGLISARSPAASTKTCLRLLFSVLFST